jgi:hypothetical protein
VPVRLHREVTVELPISVLGEGGVEVKVEEPAETPAVAEPETASAEAGAED